MNITSELRDRLIALGFTLPPPLKPNQAEGLFIVVTKNENGLNPEFRIRIPNNDRTDLLLVISLLINEVYSRGVSAGVKYGRREVGQYIKTLIEQ